MNSETDAIQAEDRPFTAEQIQRALDLGQIIDDARTTAGLSDFGESGFEEPLVLLLDCAARDTPFHHAGLQIFRRELVRCLVNRLRMRRDLSEHPEILKEDVSDPLVVIGLGRSGTTKLHKMLSAPADVQKTYFWRLWSPGRLSDQPNGGPDPRIAIAGLAPMIEGKPIPDSIHHYDEGEVDEDGLLHMLTFDDYVWNYMTLMPSYFDLMMGRSAVRAYSEVKAMLQYLQWQDGGKRDRPWVLKSIMHIANLEALLQVYPKATLVFPHRDPKDTIPSLAKWQASSWAIQGVAPPPHFVGRETLRMRGAATRRCLDARQQARVNDRIPDARYEDVRADPMPIIEAIYEHAERRLSHEAYGRMRAWHDNNRQNQFGENAYSLEEFGLDEAAIDNEFKKYSELYI